MTAAHGRDAGRDRGAVILEFAIVAALFMTLLWGIIAYGVIFAVQQNMTHGASEAARATITQGEPNRVPDPCCPTYGVIDDNGADTLAIEAFAMNLVTTDQLDWHPDLVANATVTVDVHECDYDQALDCLTVEITYPWGTAPIVPVLFDVAVPDVLEASATVQLSQGS